MKLSHLLADAIRSDREIELATRRLAAQATFPQATSAPRATRPHGWFRRLLPAI
jgi:hypothetical protein